MIKIKHIILYIFIVSGLTGVSTASEEWEVDTPIKTGLDGYTYYSSPTVFSMAGERFLIIGEFYGGFYGYKWNNTQWETESDIVFGLPNMGYTSAPTVFNLSGTYYMITGNSTGRLTGFKWDVIAWVSASNIENGLDDVGLTQTKPDVFYMDDTWYLIHGVVYGTYTGYKWTGSTWIEDSNIVDGLDDVGDYATIAVFEKFNTWYAFLGNEDGEIVEYRRYNNQWISDTQILKGFTGVADYADPEVFHIDDIYYMLVGRQAQIVHGYSFEYLKSDHDYSAYFDDLYDDVTVWGMLSAVFGTYEDICTPANNTQTLFWLIIILIPFTMTWIKQQSVIIPSILALICGSTLFVLLPNSAGSTVTILLSIGVMGVLYHVLKKG